MLKRLISDLWNAIRRAAAKRGLGTVDEDRNRFRWEVRFEWRRPFFDCDSFMDGGSRYWKAWPLTAYRWIVHPEH